MAQANTGKGSEDISNQVEGKRKLCQPCLRDKKKTIPQLFCKTCRQYQCKNCNKQHDKFLPGHEVVKANEASALDTEVDLQGLDNCPKHREQFEYYCKSHKKLCCKSCCSTVHQHCLNVNKILKEVSSNKVAMHAVDSQIQKLRINTHEMGKLLDKTDDTSGQLDSIISLIDSQKATIAKRFDELKATVIRQFKTAEEKLAFEKVSSAATIQSITDDIDAKAKLLQSVRKNGSPEQIFIATQAIEKQLDLYNCQLLEKMKYSFQPHFHIQSSESLKKILDSTVNVATFYADKIPVDPSNTGKEKVTNLQLVGSVDLKQGADDRAEPLYTGLDFFPDGRLAVVDNKNWKLYVLNENLEKIGLFKFMNTPQCVCTMSNSQAAVSTGGVRTVEFFFVGKTNDISLIKAVNVTSQYLSICLMNEKTFLVRTIDEKLPMRMVTLTGEEKDFQNLPEKTYALDQSYCSFLPSKKILVLTDRYDHAVHLYDVMDNFVTRRVVKDDAIREPLGVCTSPENDVFVCSKNTDSIIQMSPAGKVISSNKISMAYPSFISVSKNGKRMAVSNCCVRGRKLQLFHLM